MSGRPAVAHLLVHGADPGRILLLTFSRRAAAEMERRPERIAAATRGQTSVPDRSPISWWGTFHAVGARVGGAPMNQPKAERHRLMPKRCCGRLMAAATGP
jgi:hypothetical protein